MVCPKCGCRLVTILADRTVVIIVDGEWLSTVFVDVPTIVCGCNETVQIIES